MTWHEPSECALCGRTGDRIQPQLIEWFDALPGMRFAHVDRCEDRAACRARVEAADKPWPVVEEER